MPERIEMVTGGYLDPVTGDWVEPDDDPVPFDVDAIAPAPSSDTDADGRQGFKDSLTVYAPRAGQRPLMGGLQAPEVTGDAEFIIRGRRYVLEGAVGEWVNPFVPGFLDGVQFTVRRAEG